MVQIELLILRLKDDPEDVPLGAGRPEILRHEGVNRRCSRYERSRPYCVTSRLQRRRAVTEGAKDERRVIGPVTRSPCPLRHVCNQQVHVLRSAGCERGATQVLVELGLQLAQLLLSLPHVFLQLQARLSGIVVASRQSSPVAHLVA
ncbi:hypothetical protein EYF80_027641 [Liparis tanakae]|uniref:Uncharacterized protein n=1 Tax=Liparis tanakae TaxID=230148 RepID=A0A4Z2H970_9TELE|nr:hypothetical protein EYF80_027641 [Liparis tanakae]